MNMKFGIVVAAAACAASLFADGISSANIVGYQQKDLREGSQALGATFIAVAGADQCKMGDLTVTGYEGEYAARAIYCTKLNAYGGSVQKMYWFDTEVGGVKYYGWYTKKGEDLNDVKLAPGEGIWFTAPAGVKLQSSGQVLSDALPVALPAGSILCANPTPIAVKMANVVVTGYGESYVDRGIYATKLDAAGRSVEKMYWFDTEAGGTTYYGWYTKKGASFADAEVDPGDALWVTSPNADLTLTWPAAIAK